MTKVYILTFKQGARYAYTSIAGLFEDHTAQELGVSKATIDHIDFSCDRYENKRIIIERLIAKSVVEIRQEKKQFV